MSCRTRPGPVLALTYVHDTTGVHISRDDWHALRKVIELESGKPLSQAPADPMEVREVLARLSESISRQEHLGDTLRASGLIPSWGYNDEDTRELMTDRERAFDDATRDTIRKALNTRVTKGTLDALEQLCVYGTRVAPRRARAILRNPYIPSEVPPPDQIVDIADEVTRQADNVWFESCNWQHEEGDEVALGDMQEAALAGNNCNSATAVVFDIIEDDALLPEGWEHSRVETMHLDDSPGQKGSGVHWANMISSPNGDRWVVDYTARQFGGDVPFPLIAPYDHWLAHVSTRTRAIWGSDLVAVWQHNDSSPEGTVLFASPSATDFVD